MATYKLATPFNFSALFCLLIATNKPVAQLFANLYLTDEIKAHDEYEVKFNDELLGSLKAFILSADESLYNSLIERLESEMIYKEVYNHFSQDESELSLQQSFEAGIRASADHDSFNERLSAHRNEY